MSEYKKICSVCLIEKNISNFYINKGDKYKHGDCCKTCARIQYNKYYYRNHLEKILNYKQKWYIKSKEWRKVYKKNYRRKNKSKIKEYNSKPYIKIINCIRTRIYGILKGKNKSKHTLELLGCTAEEFKIYLEKQFQEGMTWNNHGRGCGKWNIDHIIPCIFFNIIDPVEQQQCFHFTNHQPLWERGLGGNLEKHSKIRGLKLLYNDPTPFI